jgi:hypothetical protein
LSKFEDVLKKVNKLPYQLWVSTQGKEQHWRLGCYFAWLHVKAFHIDHIPNLWWKRPQRARQSLISHLSCWSVLINDMADMMKQ